MQIAGSSSRLTKMGYVICHGAKHLTFIAASDFFTVLMFYCINMLMKVVVNDVEKDAFLVKAPSLKRKDCCCCCFSYLLFRCEEEVRY